MIQLSFQPALDPFHSMFRFMRLRPVLRRAGERPVDHVRILDFYMAFPFRIEHLRVKPEHRRLKTAAMKFNWPVPYGDRPDDKIVFLRMEPIQEVALQTLASHRLVDGAQLDRRMVLVAEAPVPSGLASRIDEANAREGSLLELLGVLAGDYDLMGQGGLKERSGLLEHRYDAA